LAGQSGTSAPVLLLSQDLANGHVRDVPFPFDPDWMLEVLGMGSYGPAERYKMKRDNKTVRLTEASPSKAALRKEILLQSEAVAAPKPQVLAYSLVHEMTGEVMCSAKVIKTQVDHQTGAIVPRNIQFSWTPTKQHSITLAVTLDGLSVNPLVPNRVFTRGPLPGVRAVNLATERSETK